MKKEQRNRICTNHEIQLININLDSIKCVMIYIKFFLLQSPKNLRISALSW